MKELRRILSNRRLLIGLVLILLLNGVLFAREQSENNYGLDLELPSGGFVIFDGAFTVTQEPVDAWAAYLRYSAWLDRVRNMPFTDAMTMLTDEKAALSVKITGDTDTENGSYLGAHEGNPMLRHWCRFAAHEPLEEPSLLTDLFPPLHLLSLSASLPLLLRLKSHSYGADPTLARTHPAILLRRRC